MNTNKTSSVIKTIYDFAYDAVAWLVVISLPISYLLAVMNELLAYNWK